ncbi:mersacidin/lichenicidin family type 2 lantibiotic [Thermosporothrix hazakensis]|jgi:mersacidin/lichenicidin family type 2 lantibiotic|uniref:Mersacidin/lichenicidin family type 2 lantibiotic n=2 Tax=Thermosporothrix TaxID=768650 RepID=A0A326U5W2_THEHA|nr:mersacidin/lichenicidin family type 2 lantibiotic [Thermosporothrix hazakensis]PZW29340.1 mersacidin/lichenicidin family type 2 lantibiotic [Thermosporothrix hazakensis]BBH86269.1 hypothetical protein KTC_10200 [Thermosporothrix sp. COM3]GCE45309.1 hypothetical protein KTH_01780 [Thermosporothrix hazakensis]
MNSTIIRAWKDARFRKQLSEEERARLPASPVGEVCELRDEELSGIAGGRGMENTQFLRECRDFSSKYLCFSQRFYNGQCW